MYTMYMNISDARISSSATRHEPFAHEGISWWSRSLQAPNVTIPGSGSMGLDCWPTWSPKQPFFNRCLVKQPFLCNDLESSSWNNHKKLVVWTSRCITVGDKMATLKKRGKCFRTVKIFPILPWIHVGNGKTVKSWWLVPTWKICARRKSSNGSESTSK